MMKFINTTKDDALTLSAGKGAMCLDWFIDASFVVSPDCRSHSGMAMQFCDRKGCPLGRLEKQKLNTDSSTVTELAAAHQFLPKVLWTPSFLKEPGHDIEKNVTLQDNKSAISLEEMAKEVPGKELGQWTHVIL